jgi:protein-L-isoaspartate(D-aspartate) O-methyltransferase
LELDKWTKLVNHLIKQGVLRSDKVKRAMLVVPRTNFIPQDMKSYSASDTPLPIGFGQTISAPHSYSLLLG